MFGKIISFNQKEEGVEILFENRIGKIEVITESIINVFAAYKTAYGHSQAVENLNKKNVHYKAKRTTDAIEITTSEVIVKVYDEFKVDFFNKYGIEVCKDYRGDRKFESQISDELLKLMEKEGHQVSSEKHNYKIQVVKVIDGDETFYGLGDKTGFLNKRNYEYEMWNTDNPAPQVDSFTALYKTIPFLITLKKECVYGIFFDNTYHSYFDMGKEDDKYYYFGSDNGNLNYYYIAGDSIPEIVSGYSYLTGTAQVPQLWTLGYHQSRWGYESEKEIRYLAKKIRECGIPCDTIHLDIDYMDEFKVFTWNKERYDDSKKMIKDLCNDGFKLVTIIDPGVKVEEGYHIYDEGVKENYFAKTPDGEIYVNAVWPGDSVYPDFGKIDVQKWWADNQKLLVDLGIRGVWNDMNEPASFNGELPDNIIFHDEDRETNHAEMHNVYGHLMCKATYEGLRKYDKRRPFVITRACYSGSQKYTTAWTGDNHSIWAHLQMSIPQLCNLGLSGMSFVGADVGGFGSDTTAELLTRWVQVGCFSPLFRNHCGKAFRYQEPWQFGKQTLDIYRNYVQLRYRLLPYFYDLFFLGESTGLPIMRPLVFHYEKDENVKNLNDEFLVGEHILVSPVINQGDTKKLVYLPEGIWIDYWTKEKVVGQKYLIKDAPIDICPIYIKSGSIIPNFISQQFVGEKVLDELILDIYEGDGSYTHYQDNGENFDYKKGIYNEYQFTINKQGLFTARLLHQKYNEIYKNFRVYYKDSELIIPFDGEEIEYYL
nr:glycoside hydrolase family 31 protein [Clostridium chromiireducens]